MLVSASTAFGSIEIFPIIHAASDQQFPAIDDCTVVCQDNRSGDWDISVANISDPCDIIVLMLADEFRQGEYPAISGNIVVWQSKLYLYEDYDILGIDLSTQASFEVLSTFADERLPAISGDWVVAQTRTDGDASWDVVGVDISNPDDPHRFWLDDSREDDWRPDIHGSMVVYEDSYDGMPFISGRDISDPNRPAWFPVYGRGDTQQTPAIYGNWVVWQDKVQDASVIAGDNIFHPVQARVFESDDPNTSASPDIYNNVVVWQDRRNGNWDIYGYNLTTKVVFAITSNPADQTDPAITFSPRHNGYVVVWQDNRNGDWDIYGALIRGAEIAGCVSPLAGDVNADGVVDANDLDAVQHRLGQQNGILIRPN
jgi:beta propeller repeat protein